MYAHLRIMEFPIFIIGWIHFEFQGCYVVINNLIQISKHILQATTVELDQKLHSAFCSVSSVSALFADGP